MFISASYLRRGRRWRIKASEEEGLLFRASPEVFLLANRGVGGRRAAVESSHLVPVAVESRRTGRRPRQAAPEGEGEGEGGRAGRRRRRSDLELVSRLGGEVEKMDGSRLAICCSAAK
ncbi:unnamed protein product [Linum trigynum]|uniref:Uncharacterized protein n=1 Tax=Linum trigynum TaxID=586398 RepID=A0AAV2GLU3_9ROSI